MKHCIITLTLLLLTDFSIGQTFQRLNNETAEQFVTRLNSDSLKIEHKIIKTTSWDTTRKIIIVFYSKKAKNINADQTDTINEQPIVGFLYFETQKQLYQKILIDTFDLNDKIESVFFANADTDKDKELCILLSNKPDEYVCKCDGTYYSTRVYDKPNFDSKIDRLKYLREISIKFDCFDGVGRWNYIEEAKYKTADDVKKELKHLRYK